MINNADLRSSVGISQHRWNKCAADYEAVDEACTDTICKDLSYKPRTYNADSDSDSFSTACLLTVWPLRMCQAVKSLKWWLVSSLLALISLQGAAKKSNPLSYFANF